MKLKTIYLWVSDRAKPMSGRWFSRTKKGDRKHKVRFKKNYVESMENLPGERTFFRGVLTPGLAVSKGRGSQCKEDWSCKSHSRGQGRNKYMERLEEIRIWSHSWKQGFIWCWFDLGQQGRREDIQSPVLWKVSSTGNSDCIKKMPLPERQLW